MPTRFVPIAAATLAGLLVAPALAQDRRGEGPRIGLEGPGVPSLLPELRRSPRGRAFVARFDANRDGRIGRREAEAANRAFVELADRDGFDRAPPAIVREDDRRGGWDRRAMRDYHFRQTRAGATLVLQDVLFRTGSAALRPGAAERLRPLADYLRATPGVRLSIDGHTDAVGAAAANLSLSDARAATVRGALASMGVAQRRVRATGHGEAAPVADNATAAGRQLNRRVEVTLLGQQARSYDYSG